MEGILEWYEFWHNYRYHNEINFVVYIPLLFFAAVLDTKKI
ncbi:hypothetical protein SPSYN_02547 [Sporotomaculum syntrophicum]|uniref:Uncharacterized protein n=1 Tax=Sporotomaculum syntrophicum TaxID=182264 RepID=A0A9D2WMW9_9FIRM|nr:hypothetical protein SPSYN_02547 [Sporotomaculum syntrophicum]